MELLGIDVSTLQRPLLLILELSSVHPTEACAVSGSVCTTPQRHVLHIDVSTLQRPVLHLDVSTPQRPMLHLDVSTLQRHVLHIDVSTLQYKGLC
jgi:hypothetical protein